MLAFQRLLKRRDSYIFRMTSMSRLLFTIGVNRLHPEIDIWGVFGSHCPVLEKATKEPRTTVGVSIPFPPAQERDVNEVNLHVF